MRDSLHDDATERALLSVLLDVGLTSPSRMVAMVEHSSLFPAHFAGDGHADLLTAALGIARKGTPVDPVLLGRKSKLKPSAIGEIVAAGGVEAAFDSYAETVRGAALRRRLFETGTRLRSAAFDDSRNPVETLAEFTRDLAGIRVRGSGPKLLEDVLSDCIERIEQNQFGELPEFVTTGLPELDNALGGGLQPSVLTLIGADPGVGKSALLATIVSSAAQAGKAIGLFSLEDEAYWLGWRIMASHSNIPQPVLKARRLTDAQRQRLVGAIDQCSIYASRVFVDDRPRLTAGEICQAASAMVVEHGVKAVIVDHLGEVRIDSRGDRHDLQVGDAVRELRDVAKRHSIPVVVASQLARRKGRGPGDMPEKSDFRNSGDIEAVARVMLGLARKPGSNELRIGLLKNTNGIAGVEVPLEFYGLAAMVRSCEGREQADYYRQEDGA